MRTCLSFLFLIFCLDICAQSPAADQLIDAGVELHDAGDYRGALAQFDAAIELDSGDCYIAMAEKSNTLFFMNDFAATAALCEHILKRYPEQKSLGMIYANLGNSLDMLEKPKEAISVYRRGLKTFPREGMLWYNMGIAYLRTNEMAEGEESLLKAMACNPVHPGTHFALGSIWEITGRRTPAIMAYLRFLVFEVGSPRSEKAQASLFTLLDGQVEKKGRKSVTIQLDQQALESDGKEDNFVAADLMLDIMAGAALDRKEIKRKKKLNAVEIRLEKLETVLSVGIEMYQEGSLKGAIAEAYVPFYASILEQNHLEAMVYTAHAGNGKQYVENWFKENLESVKSMVNWIYGEDQFED